ncbi:MAG: trehalose-phosphatase [Acidimicrobiales bacterium]
MPAPLPFTSFLEHPEASILVVDFDGTVAPIVREPDDAYPLPEATGILNRLVAQLGCVAVVSGRTLAFLLDRLAECPGVVLAGNYGVERLVNGQPIVDDRVAPHLAAIQDAAGKAHELLPDLLVEVKSGLSVTIHWRTRPELEGAAVAVAYELAQSLGLVAHPARKAVELRPPVEIDKGTVVAELCKGYAHAVYAGDDQGDLPAFRMLRRLRAEGVLSSALLLAVTSQEAPPDLSRLADVALGTPGELTSLLGDLAEQLERQPRAGRKESHG